MTQGYHVCPLQETHAFLPHEKACSSYYECKNGIQIEKKCPSGTYFDSEENRCITGDCKENREVYRLEFFPHETDCNKYYMSIKGKQSIYACPSDLHFNLDSQVCDYPWKAKCSIHF
ncbi:hypothetical protein FQA39_LY01491 [Lamprigera yunnana]|nr:hypothetical protein FQA39_LY01491 [Lamprigera yunnana]